MSKQKFNIGDHVNVKKSAEQYTGQAGVVYRVTTVGKNSISVVHNDKIVKFSEKHLKRWKPKYNEWCWFWGKISTGPGHTWNVVLSQFEGMCDNDLYTANRHQYSFCEPFIGELPSRYKD
jgi:hypothetical protein